MAILNDFYDEFLCEQKDVTGSVGITNYCKGAPVPPPPHPPSPCTPIGPPPIPPQTPSPQPFLVNPPAPKDGYLPVVLVNNTGLQDNEVYFVIFGQEPQVGTPCAAGDFSFVSFGGKTSDSGFNFNIIGTTGGDAKPTGSSTPPASDFSYRFDQVPLTDGLKLIYIPFGVISGEVLFSLNESLPLTVENNSIAVPNPALNSDPSYSRSFGQSEFTLLPLDCDINKFSIDVTNVDYFGIPIQFALVTETQQNQVGAFFSQEASIDLLLDSFATASPQTSSAWESLILTKDDQPLSPDKSNFLRILAPGEALFGPPSPLFDVNYFDNPAYGYSWAENIWTGPNAYLRKNPFTVVTNGATSGEGPIVKHYIGQVEEGTFNLVFKNALDGVEKYTIPWYGPSNPNTPSLSVPPNTTSASFFNVSNFLPGTLYTNPNGETYPFANPVAGSQPSGTIPPTDEVKQLTKIFSSAIIPGAIPGRINKLTNSGPPPALIETYYRSNSSLPNYGACYGPWYDLYSVGIIGIGGPGTNISRGRRTGNVVYAYAYDDYLYVRDPILDEVNITIPKIDQKTYLMYTINEVIK